MNSESKLLLAALLAGLSATASAEIPIDVIGGSEVSFEGLLQADINHFRSDVADLDGDALDGGDTDHELRRAEFVLKGKGPGAWNWVLGYDAKADKFLDANVGYRFAGSTVLTIGQSKQPNSLEELSSTKNNDFIAKAMTTNLQAVARRLGVSLATGGDDWTLAGSVFDRELTRRLANGAGFGARGTWAPVNDRGRLLHLGLSYVDVEAEDSLGKGRARFRVRPDADLAGVRLVDSGQLTDADRIATVGGELVWVHGPLKVQAEAMRTRVGRDFNPDYAFDSAYVSGVWNLTGETWGYRNGVVTTGLPDDPAAGLWQLGVRHDRVDLDDGAVFGGRESNWTIGLNHYWRSNFKTMLNVVAVRSERGADPVRDDPSIVEFRAQLFW